MESMFDALEVLIERQYADRKELRPYVASSTKAWNDYLDMMGETIVDTLGNKWELIPEDRIFELCV